MQEQIERLRSNIAQVYLGPIDAIDQLICCLLARGHALLEDVPGVGKTVLASALARSLDCSFSRIQLTPDLLPSDVLGVSVFNRQTSEFDFKPGPIFANLVLADEINRTTPRTQTALLEAMNEATVSIAGQNITLRLPAAGNGVAGVLIAQTVVMECRSLRCPLDGFNIGVSTSSAMCPVG